MEIEDFKKVIALVFIEAKAKADKEHVFVPNKTKLAEKIVKNKIFNNGPNEKTLRNYFNYFFGNSKKKINPREETINSLLQYINYQSQYHFINNQPLNEDYLNHVPFSNQKLDNSDDEKCKLNFVSILCNKYLTDSNFNSIKVNGDVDNKLGTLSMDEYYIQLSYISYEDTYNRDSLLKLEKEYSYSKVYKNTFHQNDLSKDYISKNILVNDKVIISGNPGVGKSTYAKNLCYQWAKDSEVSKNIKPLIFVQLRDVNFKKEDALLNYTNSHYFSDIGSKLASLEDLDSFQFILDGFDELPFNKRIKLTSLIKDYKYVVLSRPYGLINHQLNYDISIQIDGFNNNCIEQYLDVILNNEQKKKKLLTLIKKNKVLEDYASTPLMLSYITLIFVTSRSVKKDLTSIKSIYDLQEKVFNWILEYALKKGSINPKLLQNSKYQIEEFAYHLQLNKQFVYASNFDDKYTATVNLLSALGLGSQKKNSDNTNSWQFSFHTITFQEFLTVRYLKSQKLNIEAIIYLVTDPFFWNLCIMLVGMLSKDDSKFNKHSELLTDVLEFLHQFYSKKKHQYYGYAYYMLLAECDNEIIARVIKKTDLNQLIKFYKKAYFDNFWNTIIIESINKIIYKLPYQIQTEFINQLNNDITEISRSLEREIDVEQNYFYLLDLIKIGINYDEEAILNSLIPVLTSLKNKTAFLSDEALSSKYDNIENYENEKLITEFEALIDEETWARSNLSSFLNVLELFSSKEIKNYKEEITIIYKEEMTSVSVLKNVLFKIASVPTLEIVEEQFNLLMKFKEENDVITDEKIQDFYFNLIIELAENLLIVINSVKSFQGRNKEKIITYLKFLVNDITNTKHYEYINDFYFGHLIDVIIENLTLINSSKLYDLLFNIVNNFNAIIFTRIPNQIIFDNYIMAVFNEVLKTLDLSLIDKLIGILRSSPNARFYFLNYRASLFKVFKLLVKKNMMLLENEDIKDENYKKFISVLEEITQIPEKNYDKKYFLEEIKLNDLTFVYKIDNGILLKTIATNFIYYENIYWELFNNFFEENHWKISTVLPFVINEELFLFKSNHFKLVSVFINLFENKANYSKDELLEEGGNILVFISHILMCLKQFKDSDLKYKALKLIERVLKNKYILKFCNYKIIDLTSVEYLLSYVLFNFYNPINENFLIKLDINTQLGKETGAKMMLMNRLIEFTKNENYGIEIHEIEKFKPILGDVFYQELKNLIEQRLINKNVFDAQYFESLLMI